MKTIKTLRILSIIIVLLTVVISGVGIFWQNEGEPFSVENIYGEQIKLFGNGLYAHDSYFKAPINKGTDVGTLFLVIPVFLVLIFLIKRNTLKLRILHLGVLSYLLYYASSLAFGVAYNSLFLVYILFFSLCLFGFVLSIFSFDMEIFKNKLKPGLPRRGLAAYLFFAGLSVFVWLIEIVGSLKTGNPPSTLGMYTTEPTFVLDLGIIAPSAFTAVVLVLKRKPAGYLMASILLMLNMFIGVIVILQTVCQQIYGVNISLGQFIAYVGIFVIMSLFAAILTIKIQKRIED